MSKMKLGNSETIDGEIRFVSPFVNSSMSLVSIAFEMMFVYRGISTEDFGFASEAFCYIVILGTVPLVYISVLYNRNVIFNLLNDMNEDFICICKLGPKHRDHFLSGQLIVWKMCILWFSFCWFTSTLYVGNTIVLTFYQSMFATKDEHMIRPLIFPMWLPEDDPYRTPNYEIFMFYEIIIILIMVQNFGAYVYTQFHYLLHYYFLMDMIILDLEMIFKGQDDAVALLPKWDPRRKSTQRILNSKMKRIVDWHNSVFKSVRTVASIYGPPLSYLVMFSSLAICILAYQVVEELERGKIEFLFALLWFGTVMQLWIPCYLGTLICTKMQNHRRNIQSQFGRHQGVMNTIATAFRCKFGDDTYRIDYLAYSIGDACWESGWQDTPLARMLRTDLIIVIMRSQRPLYIKFTGLPSLTLEAFSSMMRSSYTYFNMLRQSTKG